jgi:hypothetical protein
VLKTPKIPQGNPYSWATVWSALWNYLKYENEFQNPLFQQTISLFPEHSTLE